MGDGVNDVSVRDRSFSIFLSHVCRPKNALIGGIVSVDA